MIELANDQSGLVRTAAIWALSQAAANSGSPALATLVAAAADQLRSVRINAGWGLARVKFGELAEAERGPAERAINEWRTAMDQRLESAETHHTLGIFYTARGDNDSARAAYRQAIKLAPGSVPPRHNLAMLLVQLGESEEAETLLRQVNVLEPGFAPALCSLGMLLGDTERWREAVAALTNCLKADPYYPGGLHDLSFAYLELGESELANVVLEAALDHPRARREALHSLVALNSAIGEFETARNWARVAVDEDPRLAGDGRIQELLAR